MSKIKLVIIASFPKLKTGMPRVNVEFLTRLLQDSRIKHIDLICAEPYSHVPNNCKKEKLTIHKIWLTRRPWQLFKFLKIIRGNNILLNLDIPTFSNIASNIFKKFLNVRIVQHIPDMISYIYPDTLPKATNFTYRFFGLFLRNTVDNFFVTTNSVKKDIIKYWRIKSGKIVVIPLASFIPLGDYRTDFVGRCIITVSTLEKRKNIKILIEAFKKVYNDLSDTKLILIGKKGDEYDDLNTIINTAINDGYNIVQTGYVSDEEIVTFYKTADLFVFPSLYEGFGLPVLEAMTCGCPVITSNVSSLPEVIGDAGILVDPKDVNCLALTMKDVLVDKKKMERMSKFGIERAKQFSWDESTERLITLLGDSKNTL